MFGPKWQTVRESLPVSPNQGLTGDSGRNLFRKSARKIDPDQVVSNMQSSQQRAFLYLVVLHSAQDIAEHADSFHDVGAFVGHRPHVFQMSNDKLHFVMHNEFFAFSTTLQNDDGNLRSTWYFQVLGDEPILRCQHDWRACLRKSALFLGLSAIEAICRSFPGWSSISVLQVFAQNRRKAMCCKCSPLL